MNLLTLIFTLSYFWKPGLNAASAEDRPNILFCISDDQSYGHTGAKGYPCRALRTKGYMYIHNFEPMRWPSRSPDASVCARGLPFGEIDSSPTKTFMMEHRNEQAQLCGISLREIALIHGVVGHIPIAFRGSKCASGCNQS